MSFRLIFPSRLSETGLGSGRRIVKIRSPETANVTAWTTLALIADALHNFSDAISLIIAFFARKIARRPADESMSFGYGRAEVVAALVNYTTLIVLALYLIYEGVLRALAPESVEVLAPERR